MMNLLSKRMAIAVLTAGAVVAWPLLGCDAGADENTRMNDVLSGTTPVGNARVDVGILKDQTAYQPAPYEGGPAAAPDASGEAAAGGEGGETPADTPEIAEVRQGLDGILSAAFNLDVDEILNAFDPAAVAALRDSEFVDAAKEAVATTSRMFEVSRAKSPESAGANEAIFALLPMMKTLAVQSFDIELADRSATARLTPQRVKATAERMRGEIVPAIDKVLTALPEQARQQLQAQLGVSEIPTAEQAFDHMIAMIGGDGAATESSPQPAEETPPADGAEGEAPQPDAAPEGDAESAALAGVPDELVIPLKKVEDRWRLDVPFQFTADQATALTDAARQVMPLLADLTTQLEGLENPTAQDVEQLTQGWSAQNQFQFLAIFGQLATAFSDLGPAATPEGDLAPAEGDTAPDGDAVPEGEPAPEDQPAEAPVDPAAPSLSTQVQPIFSSRCTSCHRPNTPAWVNTKLNLGDGLAREALIGQASEQDQSLILVTPGDPAASYLLQKIESDSPAFGRQMPPKGGPLTPEEIELIRKWIEAGAPNN